MSVSHSLNLRLFAPSPTAIPTHASLPPPTLLFPRHRRLPYLRASSSPEILVSDNNGVPAPLSDPSSIEVDSVTEAELKENGFRSTRRTKLVCTVGPATCGFEQLEALAVGGMNVARINMCHGTREWHKEVIDRVRRLNHEKGFAVAIMMDTEGSEIHMGDLGGASSVKADVLIYYPVLYHSFPSFASSSTLTHSILSLSCFQDGEIWTFSVRAFDSTLPQHTINVNYEGFAEG